MADLEELFPWAGAVETTDPDMEVAVERVEAYSFKKPFGEKIEKRREFYEKCREDGEYSVDSYLSVITVASSIRAAWHAAAYGEGALAESFLWFTRKDDGGDAVVDVLELFGWKVEHDDGDTYWIHWTDVFTVWKKELHTGESGITIPQRPDKCPACGAVLGGPVCSFCGKTVGIPEAKPGMVKVGFRFLARSFREHIVRIVIEDCDRASEEVGDSYREQCYELFPKLRERKEKVEKKSGEFPPCVRKILQKAQDGENLSHEERFHLAAFLVNVGWDIERIVEVFSNLPDFDEERTRYQVRHIAGEVGGGTRYLPYGCEKARVKGVCETGGECGVKHPLQYYYRSKKSRGDGG